MTNDDIPGSALDKSKVNEVTKNVESADDLLKLAQAKQILDGLERGEEKAFPWENVLKFSSIAIGALVGAVILVMSGITDNFWDAYNFAREAKEAREGELADTEKLLVTTKGDLDAAKTELQSIRGQLGEAKVAKEEAEKDKLRAEEQEAEAFKERDLALAQIEAARADLAQLSDEVELAQISSVRMYLCDRKYAIRVFDRLSVYHRWLNFDSASANVPSPDVYLSVQFIGDRSFQYVSNIRSGPRIVGSRTEFGSWGANLSNVEVEFTMSKRGKSTETITVEKFSRGELAAFARGDTDRICSDKGACFHRNSTCRPESE